jgi:hypothetical protein
MSWTFVSTWHEPLRQALIPRKGDVLATSEWEDCFNEYGKAL